MNAVRNDLPQTRIGLSVSRKVGNAVIRNRWKRVIREVFRQQRTRLPVGLDLVIRPRKGAKGNFEDVAQSLHQLAIRLDKKLTKKE